MFGCHSEKGQPMVKTPTKNGPLNGVNDLVGDPVRYKKTWHAWFFPLEMEVLMGKGSNLANGRCSIAMFDFFGGWFQPNIKENASGWLRLTKLKSSVVSGRLLRISA